jgi:hypothetical protein
MLLVCNWPLSVGQNHFVVNMLFNRDSIIQSTSRRFCADYKSENSIPCQPSGRRVIPSGRRVIPSGRPAVQCFIRSDNVTYRPDAHQTKVSSVRTTWIPVRTFLSVEKLRTAPACIRPDVSASRPNDSQCLTKLQIFFPKSNMGRLLQLSGRRGLPFGRATP